MTWRVRRVGFLRDFSLPEGRSLSCLERGGHPVTVRDGTGEHACPFFLCPPAFYPPGLVFFKRPCAYKRPDRFPALPCAPLFRGSCGEPGLKNNRQGGQTAGERAIRSWSRKMMGNQMHPVRKVQTCLGNPPVRPRRTAMLLPMIRTDRMANRPCRHSSTVAGAARQNPKHCGHRTLPIIFIGQMDTHKPHMGS